MEGVAVI